MTTTKTMTTESRLRSEIDQIEQDLADKRAELARREALSPTHRLAETLHELMCRHNHADQCDWFYGSWGQFHSPYSSRSTYMAKAGALLAAVNDDVDAAEAVVTALYRN